MTVADRRHGNGWIAYLGATRVLLILDDSDDNSASRAQEDLAGWTNPADWVLAESGWYDDGNSYYVYEFEPADHKLVTTSITA